MSSRPHLRIPPEAITTVVEKVFCRAGNSRFGPYELHDRGSERVSDLLYSYRAKDASGLSVGLQVYAGLTRSKDGTPSDDRLAGSLWEQEVRLLLRLGARRHPAMPAVLGGGYYEPEDLAWVATRSTGANMTVPRAAAYLRANPAEAVRHLSQLADALALLHGQQILHRNIQPETIDVQLQETGHRLLLTRFEMSGVLANLLRPGVDAALREAVLEGIYQSQTPRSLTYLAPERLAMLEGLPGENARIESPTSDVFSLGVMAWEWFVDDLPVDEFLPIGAGHNHDAILALHAHLRERLTSAGLPRRMSELLLGMLSKEPGPRLTATEVVHELTRSYDALSTMWQPRDGSKPFLVMFMPHQSQATIHAWKWAVHKPGTAVGLRELRSLIEEDMRGAQLVYSPQGAVPFVNAGARIQREAAKWVLLGRRAAWFCVVFKRPELFGGGETAFDEILLIKYVARVHDAGELQLTPLRRRVATVDAISYDLANDAAALDHERADRPSWRPMLDSVRLEETPSHDQTRFRSAVDWLLDLQEVELKKREYPYLRETPAGASHAILRYDAERDRRRIAEHRSGLFAAVASDRPLFADFLSSDEALSEGALQVRGDDGGRPVRRDRFRVINVNQLANDPNCIEVEPSQGNRAPIPAEGWIRPASDAGSETDLRRQRDAAVELRQTEGLVEQLSKPMAIPGLSRRWQSAGRGLLGGADAVVKRMLMTQPLFALHGPPGTGKTTVISRAVEAYVRAEPGDRILIAAQANEALDHLAEAIQGRLKTASLDDVVAVRLGHRKEGDAPKLVRDLQLETRTGILQRQAKARVRDRLARGRDSEEVRAVVREWLETIDRVALEIQDRLRRGANIVYATTSGSNPRALQTTTFDIFDWVIVEEAAKAWPSELVIPLVRGVRWTLVGDHRQLPAYRRAEVDRTLLGLKDHSRADLREHAESADDYKRVFDVFGSLFEAPSSPPPVEELRMQFRMRHPIAEVVNRAFYGGKLQTDHDATERPTGLRAPAMLIDPAVVWIDTTGIPSCADKRTWFNEGEAAIIAKLLADMRPVPRPGADGFSDEPLAILTPWRAQKDRLQSAAEGFREYVHTVDAFQGREADIVVVSLVRDTRRGERPYQNLGHAAAPERVNVMLSRARRLLILVGAYDHFAGSGVEFWATICRTTDELGRRVPAGDLA